DVDCGGATCGVCAPGKKCNAATDCDSAVCTGGTCQAPSGTDGVKNGDESDIDCGGTTTGAPKCGTGKAGNAARGCAKDRLARASDGCDETKHCARGRRCTGSSGGLTCGEGEVGDAAAKNESCCVALPSPGSNSKLDKYKVTAGRMRAFIERVNGNVAGWYAS